MKTVGRTMYLFLPALCILLITGQSAQSSCPVSVSDGNISEIGVGLVNIGQEAVLVYGGSDSGDGCRTQGAGRSISEKEYGPIDAKEYEEVEVKGEGKGEGGLIADPLEPMNRLSFRFNDRFYFWVAKPAAQIYRKTIPEDFRIIFGNFYRNIKGPIRIVNNMLQLKPRQTGTEFLRFLVNSTMGAGGLRDAARDAFGLQPAPEDLGQTLGRYGFGFGFYLVLPILGPSSLRDGVGLLGDWYLSPITHLEDPYISWGMRGHDLVNDTSFRIGDYEAFKRASLDPYIAMREAYAENRVAEINK